MVDDKDSGKPKMKLRALIPSRVPATTTLGTFYARHIAAGDLPLFSHIIDKETTKEDVSLKDLGKEALKTFVVREESGTERTPALNDENYALLTVEDFAALCAATATAFRATLPDGEPVEGLGSILFDRMAEHGKRIRETAARLQEKLTSGIGGLSVATKANLGDTLSGIAALREAMKLSPAMEAIRKAQEQTNRFEELSGLGHAGKILQDLNKEQENIKKALSGRHSNSNSEELRKHENNRITTPNLNLNVERFIPPRFEETAAGRTAARAAEASEEAAAQLREVAGIIGQMSAHVEKLQTTFIVDVLPQWRKELDDGAKATNANLQQAKDSLWWTKWAVIASIAVTLATTGWQLSVARMYKLEDDEQQKVTEQLLREQLQAARDLNKQLAADSKLLREEVAGLRQSEKTAAQKATAPTGGSQR